MNNTKKTETRNMIARRLQYYNKLLKTGKPLNESQSMKYEKYKQMLEEFDKKKKPSMTPAEYLERNKQNSKERYHRLKNNEEFKEHMRELRRGYYLRNKERLNAKQNEPNQEKQQAQEQEQEKLDDVSMIQSNIN